MTNDLSHIYHRPGELFWLESEERMQEHYIQDFPMERGMLVHITGWREQMKALTAFNPKWEGLTRTPEHGEGLTFDCPVCGPKHRLCAYFSNPLDGKPAVAWQSPSWKRDGNDFSTLTLSPSIQYPCFHGWIEEGQVIDISESTMVVNMQRPDGSFGPVALSPKQVRDLCI